MHTPVAFGSTIPVKLLVSSTRKSLYLSNQHLILIILKISMYIDLEIGWERNSASALKLLVCWFLHLTFTKKWSVWNTTPNNAQVAGF